MMKIKGLPKKYLLVWEEAQKKFKEGREGDEQHAAETVQLVLKYSEEKDWDLDVLIPTAMMHDIGHAAILPEHMKYVTGAEKLPNGKLVHMLTGAKIAKEILEKIGYDEDKTAEIVDIISVHDMDRVKGADNDEMYDTDNKKIFHDLDALDRYTKKRLKSAMHHYPDKNLQEMVTMVEKYLDLIFKDEIREIAKERIRKLREEAEK